MQTYLVSLALAVTHEANCVAWSQRPTCAHSMTLCVHEAQRNNATILQKFKGRPKTKPSMKGLDNFGGLDNLAPRDAAKGS